MQHPAHRGPRWYLATMATLTALLAFASAWTAFAQSMDSGATVGAIEHPERGMVLTDGAGMTLYVFTPDREAGNVTTCFEDDGCTDVWPPVIVDGDLVVPEEVTGVLGLQERPDGMGWQLTYNGRPLYYYVFDRRPGDFTGDRVVDTWGPWFAVPIQ